MRSAWRRCFPPVFLEARVVLLQLTRKCTPGGNFLLHSHTLLVVTVPAPCPSQDCSSLVTHKRCLMSVFHQSTSVWRPRQPPQYLAEGWPPTNTCWMIGSRGLLLKSGPGAAAAWCGGGRQAWTRSHRDVQSLGGACVSSQNSEGLL